ncbi:MAG TPA: hypothetical protein PL131_05905 [Methylotenera sp.]|nr:hypothetical protein [Methylotenera sp.]HPH05389.1 hypothetical protein [Methylotenera sp.]HPN01315.1 hypothetical protein [Methylotenera sp.]
MTDDVNQKNCCSKCGCKLNDEDADYFGKAGIIFLAVFGGVASVAFTYIVISTSNGGNYGKLLVFGVVGIFTLIYKIGNMRKSTLLCSKCKPAKFQ